MIKLPTILSVFALLTALAVITPVRADDTPAGVAADVGAVQKDNTALNKDNAKLARHRADKARHKAKGEHVNQAVDSVKIGADKTMRSEKETEKSIDKKTLHNDVDSSTEKEYPTQK